MQRTLVLLKPDCVQRRLIGRVLQRIEEKGITIIAMKMLRLTSELAREHYVDHVSKPFYPSLEQFITSGPVVAMVLEGVSVIEVVRKLMGSTSGLDAEFATIRGDFSLSRQMNLVHGSDSEASAAREIAIYFSEDEICDYQSDLSHWISRDNEQ